MLMNDAIKLKEINHLKLKPIVSPKDFNGFTKLSFNHGIKGLQKRYSFRFRFHKINPS